MTILVVDDDLLVHDSVRSIIEGTQYDFQIVGDAFNGQEALEMYRQLRPEVIITDMKMPVADGLSLMNQISEDGHPCKVIVISGHDDFSYTRSAFLVGAVDYLLKPINRTELINVLIRAGKLLMEDSGKEEAYSYQGLSLIQEQFLSEITWGEAQDENTLIVMARQHKLELPQEDYRVIAIKLMNTQKCLLKRFDGQPYEYYGYIKALIVEHFPGPNAIVFNQFHKANEFVIIHNLSDKLQISDCILSIYEALRDDMDIVSLMGVGGVFEYLGDIQQAYQQASEALLGTRLRADGFACRYGKAVPSDTGPWQEAIKLMDCLLENQNINGQDLNQKLEFILSDSYIETLTIGEVADCASTLIQRLNQLLENQKTDAGGEMRSQLANIQKHFSQLSIRRAVQRLRKLIPAVTEMARGYIYNEEQFRAKIVRYIEENCATIDLSTISAHFYLNKNYFSTLFKSLTAKTFSDYLLEVRMNKAAYLLKNTSLKIYEVARQVGYDDSRYFSQVFKKAFSMQPSEYRSGPDAT